MTANAAPLPNGTILKITPGAGSAVNTPCTSGSCFAWFSPVPNIITWQNLQPGTDGGFIIGKSQASGGQEINYLSTFPGELTAAWIWGANYGTLYTQPDGGAVNVFDDTSCTKIACIGKTALNTFNIAWNGGSFPIGSSVGCTLASCTPDQQAGIFVTNYSIDLVGKTWSMEYAQLVSSGPFTGVDSHVIFRGTVIIPNCPVVDFALQSPNTQLIVVFGTHLTGATEVLVNGIKTTVFQVISDDILWAFIPAGVPLPWKPGTVQVSNASCAGSYPKPCTP